MYIRVYMYTHMYMPACISCGQLLPRIRISHVTDILYVFCRTFEGDMPLMSCFTHQRVMLHTWKSHVTNMKESRHTCEWATSRIRCRQIRVLSNCCEQCIHACGFDVCVCICMCVYMYLLTTVLVTKSAYCVSVCVNACVLLPVSVLVSVSVFLSMSVFLSFLLVSVCGVDVLVCTCIC